MTPQHGEIWRDLRSGEERRVLMVCGTSGKALVSGMDFQMPLEEFLATHELRPTTDALVADVRELLPPRMTPPLGPVYIRRDQERTNRAHGSLAELARRAELTEALRNIEASA